MSITWFMMNLCPPKPHAETFTRTAPDSAIAVTRTASVCRICEGYSVQMPRLGAHLSIAGGLPRAVDRAEASGCEALQIFTKSAGQWRAREIPSDEIALFRRRVRQAKLRPVVAHNSYL